jgi:hypothetical protein
MKRISLTAVILLNFVYFLNANETKEQKPNIILVFIDGLGMGDLDSVGNT